VRPPSGSLEGGSNLNDRAGSVLDDLQQSSASRCSCRARSHRANSSTAKSLGFIATLSGRRTVAETCNARHWCLERDLCADLRPAYHSKGVFPQVVVQLAGLGVSLHPRHDLS
jgi:hypothetical protein